MWRCGRCRSVAGRVTRSASRVWTGLPAVVWNSLHVVTTGRLATVFRGAPSTTTLTPAGRQSVYRVTVSVGRASGRLNFTVTSVRRSLSMNIHRTLPTATPTKKESTQHYKKYATIRPTVASTATASKLLV